MGKPSLGRAATGEAPGSKVGPLLRFRRLTADDQDQLWHWLHVALWDPPPAALRPVEVLRSPGVRIYAEAWGRPSDVGVVAQVDGIDAGACWLRLLPAGVGLASVDAATPQLGIALEPAFQHQGHGRPLLLEALAAASRAGYRQVSLTVHPENPARHLYARCGFVEIERRNSYALMVARGLGSDDHRVDSQACGGATQISGAHQPTTEGARDEPGTCRRHLGAGRSL